MSDTAPSLRDRLEALAVILACLLLFGLLAHLAHVASTPPRVMVPDAVRMLEGTCVDLDGGWGE